MNNNDAVQEFVSSAMFRRLFQEGMSLVEESAGYLDGPGREDSRTLSRRTALAYAGESMRLTTRLMQVASWLLVQKAIAEQEMTTAEASDDKYRLGGQKVSHCALIEGFEELPQRLRDLMGHSERLYDRVARLDEMLYSQTFVDSGPAVNEAIDRLRHAFGGAHGAR